jgi:hypothetical protein
MFKFIKQVLTRLGLLKDKKAAAAATVAVEAAEAVQEIQAGRAPKEAIKEAATDAAKDLVKGFVLEKIKDRKSRWESQQDSDSLGDRRSNIW